MSKLQRVRTPTVLQMDAVEGGAAALGIILAYHGRFVPLAKLREDCGVSRNGTKASAIVSAAKLHGLIARAFEKPADELKTIKVPFVAFWNFNNYVIIEGWNNRTLYVNDPATGPRAIRTEEFVKRYMGVVLTFEKSPAFRKGGVKESLLRSLRPRLAGSNSMLSFVVFATLGLVVPGLVVPVLYRVYVDNILVGGSTEWLRPLIFALLLACIVKCALTVLQQRCLFRLDTRLALRSSGRFFSHVLRLPMEFFSQRRPNEVGMRVELNDNIALLLAGQLTPNAVSILMIGAYAVLMFQYDAVLTGLGVAIASLNIVTLRWVSRRRRDASSRLQQQQGKLLATATAGLQMIETLKATGTESDFFAEWGGNQASVINSQQELGLSSQILIAVPPLLQSLNLIVILCIGAVRVIDGLLTIGMLIAFQSLMATFADPVNRVVDLGGKMQELEAQVKRVDDVLQYQSETPLLLPSHPGASVDCGRLQGYIEFVDLTFGYNRLEAPLISNFNLTVKPGQRIALVGASGSGKSTVAKLVCGLYKPWTGEILLDGKPRESIAREVLSNSLAMVDQDIFLFNGSLRDNITLWDTTLPETAVLQAAKDAQIHEAISELPGAYDYIVDEGGRNFSGGQRQRLEIARALVSDPRILVLDEATSALDPKVETLVDDAVRRRGCTCLIIAHRLSTIRDCDEIVVLERGIVVERGVHAEMAAARGPYSRLIGAY
ncbi:MAG TPA: NHLP family bacteriocin export ABC transporter peptidase/permease/ATPase subunit [Bryobacteraceae bacterium]|nr:NHLP family bacteriocin export ABC transporter peptidase/permease/ATPase subunit [Bryobacteraceae bacterium]